MEYMADEELFKEFGDKKEGKHKVEKGDYHEIRIKFRRSWLVHLIYIIIIIILVILLFYNPFSSYACEKGLDEISSEPVVEEPVVVEEEPVVEEEEEVEPEPEPEPEEALSGEAGLTIGEVGLNNDSKRIEYIWIYINNDRGLFTPLLKIYWYGASATEAVKETSKYEYQFPSLITTGKTNKKLDE